MTKKREKPIQNIKNTNKPQNIEKKWTKLKLALLIYEADYDDEIMEFFSSDIVTGFTKFDRVLGAGKKSDPKLNTSVWPGYNYVILSMLSDENEDEFRTRIMMLIDKHKGSGIKLFLLPLLEAI